MMCVFEFKRIFPIRITGFIKILKVIISTIFSFTFNFVIHIVFFRCIRTYTLLIILVSKKVNIKNIIEHDFTAI